MSEDKLTIEGIEGIKPAPVNSDIEEANEKHRVTQKENSTKLSNHIYIVTVFFIYGIALSIVLMIVAYILSYYIESLKVMHGDIGGWVGNSLSIMVGFMLSMIYDKTKR